jgi:hypothetical protein
MPYIIIKDAINVNTEKAPRNPTINGPVRAAPVALILSNAAFLSAAIFI